MVEENNDIRDWVIYKITSPTGRIYVGKTINLPVRINHYKNLSCKAQPALYASFVKHGYENHKIEIIDTFKSNLIYANGKEIFWIRTNMCNKNKFPEQNGLNLADGGGGSLGHKMSEENKKKLSDHHKTGKRKTRKGVKMTPEQIEEMKKRLTGKPNLKLRGRKMPEHVKLKLIELSRGRIPWNKGTKGIMKGWNKGKKFNGTEQERKEKFGAHNIGNKYNLDKKRTGQALENIRNSVKRANSIPIIQYDLNGNFIQEFASKVEAVKHTGLGSRAIQEILKGQTKNPKRWWFKYKHSIRFKPFIFKRRIFKPVDFKIKTL